jgi:hypothetical protein
MAVTDIELSCNTILQKIRIKLFMSGNPFLHLCDFEKISSNTLNAGDCLERPVEAENEATVVNANKLSAMYNNLLAEKYSVEEGK